MITNLKKIKLLVLLTVLCMVYSSCTIPEKTIQQNNSEDNTYKYNKEDIPQYDNISTDIAMNNSFIEDDWYEEMLGYAELLEYSAEGQKIAFIDTGVNEILISEYNIVDTFNAVDMSNDVIDEQGHGTAMVSIACGNGFLGLHGLASDADIYIIKAIDNDGKITPDSLYNSLKYAYSKKVDVISLSIGGHRRDEKIEELISEICEDNITIVSSAGDYGQKDLLFPASSRYVVSVAALGDDGAIWEESNVSDALTCIFPGVDIKGLDYDLKEDVSSGTSEATALASSFILLFRAEYYKAHGINPDIDTVKAVLKGIDFSKRESILNALQNI